MKNKAIVIGKDHHNALGIIQSLGRKGILSYVVIITQNKKSYVLHSKYIKQGWCCDDEDNALKILKDTFKGEKDKAVVYACDDETAVMLDKNHDSLSSFLYLSTVNIKGTLSKWMMKECMTNLAEKVGMKVPKTWALYTNIIPEDIEYPVITKAASSIKGGKNNIHICYSKEELTKVMQGNHCNIMIVQKYIQKTFELQLIGYSGQEGDNIIIPGKTEIVRPKGIDNTFFLKYDKCEEKYETLIMQAKKFIKTTGYSGLFSMEFLCDNTGELYFTEMNFRNDGNAICVTEFGVNLPYIMYLDKTGQDTYKEITSSKNKTIYLVPEVYYFTRMLTGEVGICEYFRNMRKANCYTTYFKDDKKPFVKFLQYAILRRIKK